MMMKKKKKLTVSWSWNSSRDLQQKKPFFIVDFLGATLGTTTKGTDAYNINRMA
jgi:hypothetical protein